MSESPDVRIVQNSHLWLHMTYGLEPPETCPVCAALARLESRIERLEGALEFLHECDPDHERECRALFEEFTPRLECDCRLSVISAALAATEEGGEG